MLRQAPSPLALRALRSHAASLPFTCASCSSKRFLNASSRSQPLTRRAALSRAFTQPTPVTSVGASKIIPENLRPLYEGLQELGSSGANYVNLSQLQLALRGLESEDPTIRAAVLGVNDQLEARKLVRALLADPLGDEAEWESALAAVEDNGKGVLVRYGEVFELGSQQPHLVALSIPSAFLLRHKLEILISSTNARTSTATDTEANIQQLLIPNLVTPGSTEGRMSTIAYPVHKTIVCGTGIEGAGAVFSLVPSSTSGPELPILGVINASWDAENLTTTSTSVIPINLPSANAALSTFRQSTSNAASFEHAWLTSNLSLITPFLAPQPPSSSSLNPALRALLTTLLSNTSNSLRLASASTPNPVPHPAVRTLSALLTSWAESAHTELRDSLSGAFHSRAWRKLAWWKLPWRIDDISLVLTELVQRAYLPESERGLIYVAGCLSQAGLLKYEHPAIDAVEKGRFGNIPNYAQTLNLVAEGARGLPNSESESGRWKSFQPWPTLLSESRTRILASIPALQATAQNLLIRALSTTLLSSAVAGLAYVSVSTTSLFEAGAVSSLGLVWSARQLQRRWERTRTDWVSGVEEEGRRACVEGERWGRGVLEMGTEEKERVEREDEGMLERKKVEDVVRGCWAELEGLERMEEEVGKK